MRVREVPDLLTPIRRMDFSEPESLLQRRATATTGTPAKATSFLQTAEDPSAAACVGIWQGCVLTGETPSFPCSPWFDASGTITGTS